MQSVKRRMVIAIACLAIWPARGLAQPNAPFPADAPADVVARVSAAPQFA